MESSNLNLIVSKIEETNKVKVPHFEQEKRKKVKGIRNPHLYKREIIKNARLRGEEYINTKGVLVQAKCIPGPDCICKDHCTSLFTYEEKKLILQNLYDGKPKNEQDTFLMGLIEHQEVSRRRPRNGNKFKPKSENDQETSLENSNENVSNKNENDFVRQHTYKYNALKGTKTIQVCKQAFKSLYSIKNKALYRLCLLKSTPYISPRDMRGKHIGRPNVIPDEVRLAINDHLNTFPFKSNVDNKNVKVPNDHYIKNFLPNLTIKKMHSLFKEKFPQYADKVTYEFYRQSFRDNFNFSSSSCKVKVPNNNKHLRKNPHPKKIAVEEKLDQPVSDLCSGTIVDSGASFYLGHVVH